MRFIKTLQFIFQLLKTMFALRDVLAKTWSQTGPPFFKLIVVVQGTMYTKVVFKTICFIIHTTPLDRPYSCRTRAVDDPANWISTGPVAGRCRRWRWGTGTWGWLTGIWVVVRWVYKWVFRLRPKSWHTRHSRSCSAAQSPVPTARHIHGTSGCAWVATGRSRTRRVRSWNNAIR